MLARKAIQNIAIGAAGVLLGPEIPIAETVKTAVDTVTTVAEVVDLLAPYLEGYYDPPRTLDELHDAVRTRKTGFDVHHIIEQATAAEDGSEDNTIFGEDNLVSIPTFKHWDLNRWYQTPNEKYGRQTPRQYLVGKDLAERKRVGLDGLEDIGVLQR